MKRSILLLITHRCNLACKYCYEKFKDSRKMSSKEVISILQKEFEYDSDEITNIDLLGGEPLANFIIIPEVCEWIWGRKPNMQIFIRTNGTLLNDEMRLWFSNHRNLIGLGISVDGNPQTNFQNRGVKNIDLKFFKQYWPEVPAKITVFPDTVSSLYDSIQYLYSHGFDVTGGLAQGVLWDDKNCEILNTQLEKLVEFYISNPSYNPVSPLFSLDFNQAFSEYDIAKGNPPCWQRNIVHTYDCDYEQLPCHMFSVLVQGDKRKSIVKDALNLRKECIDEDCLSCPIRWSCVNCMALNYQRYGNFHKNVNRELSCTAHKITAYWSAVLIANRFQNNQIDLSDDENMEIVQKAISYIKLYNGYGQKD